jgi:hypothetical protein
VPPHGPNRQKDCNKTPNLGHQTQQKGEELLPTPVITKPPKTAKKQKQGRPGLVVFSKAVTGMVLKKEKQKRAASLDGHTASAEVTAEVFPSPNPNPRNEHQTQPRPLFLAARSCKATRRAERGCAPRECNVTKNSSEVLAVRGSSSGPCSGLA